ncbi:MAG: exodeoxyribonuclease VII small subunit [Anaerolineae bacterium]|nr:exodeoxyribonuclease VII small subunit [Anaerolineae bacterium]
MEDAVKELSFESALAELEKVVQRLEGGTLSLDETVTVYQRGHQLAKHCQHLLSGVELQVQQLLSSGEEEGLQMEATETTPDDIPAVG